MNPKKIYLVRHAETEFNRKRIVQGSGVDIGINEKGLLQAEAFFKNFQSIPFDLIYTSSLKRSTESVRRFIDLGIPHKIVEGLNEINWGEKEGKPFSDQDHQHYLDMISSWRKGETDVAIKDGESPEMVLERQKEIFYEISGLNNATNILVCMHGRAMRIFLCLLLNYELRYMDLFPHQNMCLYELIHTGTMFRISRYNETSHLNGLN